MPRTRTTWQLIVLLSLIPLGSCPGQTGSPVAERNPDGGLTAESKPGRGLTAESNPERGLTAESKPGRGLTAETNPDSALVEKLRSIEGDPLSLEQAVARGLEQSPAAAEAAAALRAAEGAVMREKGAFDPELFADVEKSSVDQRSASIFARPSTLKTEETTSSAGARMTLPLGTELEASVDATKTDTNDEFASVNPEYQASGRLQIRQPILKGFGPGTRSDLSSAERDLEAAQARYTDAVLGVRADVEASYWELYAAERDLAVQQLIVERAQSLLDEAQLRAQAGLVGPNDVASARVFLAQQQLASLDQEERLDDASDGLASILDLRPRQDLPRFRPTDEPPRDFPVEPVEDLVARALGNNQEIRAAERDVAAAEARARGARWNAYPALDLLGTWGGQGLGGTPQDVNFGGETFRIDVEGGAGEALRQVFRRDLPSWSVGLTLSVPLGFREGRGERNRLLAEVERARQRLAALKLSLEEQVRGRHREIVHGNRRLQIARDGVDASLEQVRIGLIEFNNGRTTAFELVRLGADLASAQQRLSQALVRTAKAAAGLRHLTAAGAGQPDPEGRTTP